VGGGEAAAYAVASYPAVTLGYVQGVADALDLAGDVGLDFAAKAVVVQAWTRYAILGNRDVGFAARLRAAVLVGGFPGNQSGLALEGAPGLSIGVPVSPHTLFTILAEVPLRLGVSGRPTYAAAHFALGLDHLFAGAGITAGVFAGVAPTLDPPSLLNATFGVRVAVPL
jgi:hypothetical protein